MMFREEQLKKKEMNQTHSPVLASMRGVSGEIRLAWWSPASDLALSCNSSSKCCRKESHCTCVVSATLSEIKRDQMMMCSGDFIL